MAVCIHCGVSKGKRACPALGGEICAPCCGKHRVVDIACPSDCRWLGGLAALRDAAVASFTADDHEAAYVRLIEFTESGRELAHSRAGFCAMLGLSRDPGRDELAAMTQQLADSTAGAVTAHIAFGHVADDGTRAVDRLLVAHGRDLTPGQVAALVALQRARGSLFHVQAAQAGVGVVLRDRLTGDIVTVPGAHDGIEQGTTAFLWLYENAGTPVPVGPFVAVPPAEIAAVEARLREAIAAGGADARTILSAAAPHVLAVGRERAAAEPVPAAEPAPAP